MLVRLRGHLSAAALAGALREVVRRHQVLRVTFGDLDGQLRLALRTLIEFPDFRAELGRRARARVVERYGLSDNLDRLLAVYRELRPAAGAAAS